MGTSQEPAISKSEQRARRRMWQAKVRPKGSDRAGEMRKGNQAKGMTLTERISLGGLDAKGKGGERRQDDNVGTGEVNFRIPGGDVRGGELGNTKETVKGEGKGSTNHGHIPWREQGGTPAKHREEVRDEEGSTNGAGERRTLHPADAAENVMESSHGRDMVGPTTNSTEILKATKVYSDGFVRYTAGQGRDKQLERRRSQREWCYLNDAAEIKILTETGAISS